jgi:isoquinoline 1-oxidoreductase beta subunit
MEPIQNPIARRQFLKTSGGVALFIGVSGILPQLLSCDDIGEIEKEVKKHRLTAWVQLRDDGHIII